MTSPYFLAVASSCISSVGTIFSRIALNDIPALWVCTFAPLFGSLFIYFAFIQSNPLKLIALTKNKPVLLYVVVRTLGAWLFIEGASRTSGTNAVFLTKIEPYCVLLWSWLLAREKIHQRELLLLLVHIFGAIILSGGASALMPGHGEGDLLIAISMVVSGYSYLVSKPILSTVDSKHLGALSLLFSGIVMGGFALTFAGLPPSVAGHEKAYAFLAMHVVTFSSMYILWLMALKHAPGWKVSALRALGPLAGLPAAWLLLNEPLSLSTLLGGALVIITSFVITKSKVPIAKIEAKAAV